MEEMELQLDLTQTPIELLKGMTEVEKHAPIRVFLGEWCMFSDISVSPASKWIGEGCYRPTLRVLEKCPIMIP
jgi:hypothetical protein